MADYTNPDEFPLVANLSASLDCQVHRIPDEMGTVSDGTNIFICERYVRLIGDTVSKAKRKVTNKNQAIIFKRSQAIYFLLHEHGHVLQHRNGTDGLPRREERANEHAASFFRRYCRNRLHMENEDALKLWNALPEHYQDPETV